MDNAITDMNRRLNNLFDEFPCGNIMATIWIHFTLHGERQFAVFGKYHIERIIISFI